MIFLTLEPDPLIFAGGVEALMGKTRGHVVVGEIGIQLAPRARHGVQAQIGNQQKQRAALDPDDDGVILTYGHAISLSSFPRMGSAVVMALSIHGHSMAVSDCCSAMQRRCESTHSIAERVETHTWESSHRKRANGGTGATITTPVRSTASAPWRVAVATRML